MKFSLALLFFVGFIALVVSAPIDENDHPEQKVTEEDAEDNPGKKPFYYLSFYNKIQV